LAGENAPVPFDDAPGADIVGVAGEQHAVEAACASLCEREGKDVRAIAEATGVGPDTVAYVATDIFEGGREVVTKTTGADDRITRTAAADQPVGVARDAARRHPLTTSLVFEVPDVGDEVRAGEGAMRLAEVVFARGVERRDHGPKGIVEDGRGIEEA